MMFALILTALLVIFIYLAIQALSWALTTIPAWWARNIIDTDPNPEPSFLDVADWKYPDYLRQIQADDRMDGLHNNKETTND